MGFYYSPPPVIINQNAENSPSKIAPLFYEVDGKIINLAAATSFYVEHLPLTSLYWPRVKIGGTSYQLAPAMKSEEEAMAFLRDLVRQIERKVNPQAVTAQ